MEPTTSAKSMEIPNKPTRAHNESAEWDDPTIDSSGFASASEPFDHSHHTSQPAPSPIPSTSTAMLDTRRIALQHGVDLDMDDPDMDEVVEIEEEEEFDYDDETSELVQAFENQHISLQPTSNSR